MGSAPLTGAYSRGIVHRAVCPGRRPGVLALLLVVSGAAAPGHAEEIAALAGGTDTDDHSSTSYAWGLQYRQQLLPHFDAGFGYLNEGHLLGHHRDGAMLQVWARTGAWLDRFDLSFGAGPYAYFDTQTSSNAEGYDDHHGVGLILSGAVSYSLTRNWFAILQFNQIVVPGNVGTRTLLLGTGYRLEEFLQRFNRATDAGPPEAVSTAANEVGVFAGISVVNTLASERSTNFGLEYRHRSARRLELSASLLDEGDGLDGRHLGVTGQGWLVQEFASRQLVLGLGLGPYVVLQGYRTSDGRPGASVVGLASMTASWRMSPSLALRLTWHRGITTDDQDRDIVTAGVARRY